MKRKHSKVPPGMFGSESELIQTLIDGARAAGYRVYPECGDWDALIADRTTGTQIGVHSKLRCNVNVLAQALTSERLPGPEIHAVLVPGATKNFLEVAKQLRIYVFQGVFLDWLDLPSAYRYAVRWMHPNRHWVPEIEVRMPAGVPAPKKLTAWKVGAVKLCLLAREKGFVTRADMLELDLDPRWWLGQKFGAVMVKHTIDGVPQRGQYMLRDPSSPIVPDLKFPEITSVIQEGAALRARPRMRVKQEQPTSARARSTVLPPASPEAEDAITGVNLRMSSNDQFIEEGLTGTRK